MREKLFSFSLGSIQNDIWFPFFNKGETQCSLWKLFVSKSIGNNARMIQNQNIHSVTDGSLMKYVYANDKQDLRKVFVKIFTIFSLMITQYPKKLSVLSSIAKNVFDVNKKKESSASQSNIIQESILTDLISLSFHKFASVLERSPENLLKESLTDKTTKLFLYQFLRESEYITNSLSSSIKTPTRRSHLSESSLSFSQSWTEFFRLEPDPKSNLMYKSGLKLINLRPSNKEVSKYVESGIVPCFNSCVMWLDSKNVDTNESPFVGEIDFSSTNAGLFNPMEVFKSGFIKNISSMINENNNENTSQQSGPNNSSNSSKLAISTIFSQISGIDDDLTDDIFTVFMIERYFQTSLNEQNTKNLTDATEIMFNLISQKLMDISNGQQNFMFNLPNEKSSKEHNSRLIKDRWSETINSIFLDEQIMSAAKNVTEFATWILSSWLPQTSLVNQLNDTINQQNQSLTHQIHVNSQLQSNLTAAKENIGILSSQNDTMKNIIDAQNVNIQQLTEEKNKFLQQQQQLLHVPINQHYNPTFSVTDNMVVDDIFSINPTVAEANSLIGNMAAETKRNMKRKLVETFSEKVQKGEMFVDQKEMSKSKENLTNTIMAKFVHLFHDISSVIHIPFFFRVLSMNWSKKMESEQFSPCTICKIIGHNKDNCVFMYGQYVGGPSPQRRDIDAMLKKSEVLIRDAFISVFKESMTTMMDFSFANTNEVYKMKNDQTTNIGSMFQNQQEESSEIPNPTMSLYYKALHKIFDFSTIFNLKDISRSQISTSNSGNIQKAARVGTTILLSPLWPTAAVSMLMINREQQFYAKSGTNEGSRICMEFGSKHGSTLKLKTSLLIQAELYGQLNNQSSTTTSLSSSSSSSRHETVNTQTQDRPCNFVQTLTNLSNVRLRTFMNICQTFGTRGNVCDYLVSGEIPLLDMILPDNNSDIMMKEHLSMDSIVKYMPFCRRKSDIEPSDPSQFFFAEGPGFYSGNYDQMDIVPQNTSNPQYISDSQMKNSVIQQQQQQRHLTTQYEKESTKKRSEYEMHFDHRLPMVFISDIAQTILIMNTIHPEELKDNTYIESTINILSNHYGIRSVSFCDRVTIYPPIKKVDSVNDENNDDDEVQLSRMIDPEKLLNGTSDPNTPRLNPEVVKRPMESLISYISDFDIIPQKKGDYFCLPTKQDLDMRGFSVTKTNDPTNPVKVQKIGNWQKLVQSMKKKGYSGGAQNLGPLSQRMNEMSGASAAAIFGSANARMTGRGCGWFMGGQNSIIDCTTKSILSRYAEASYNTLLPTPFRQSQSSSSTIMSSLFPTLAKTFFVLSRVKNDVEFREILQGVQLGEEIPHCDTGFTIIKGSCVHQKPNDVLSKVSKYFTTYAHIFGSTDPALYNTIMEIKHKISVKRIASNYDLWDDTRVELHEAYLGIMKKGGQGKKQGTKNGPSKKRKIDAINDGDDDGNDEETNVEVNEGGETKKNTKNTKKSKQTKNSVKNGKKTEKQKTATPNKRKSSKNNSNLDLEEEHEGGEFQFQ